MLEFMARKRAKLRGRLNLLFRSPDREGWSGTLPHFFRSYEKSTKKVRGGCAHPLDSQGRRKTSASLRSAGFTAIVEFPQYVETQECAVFLYLLATAG